MSKTEEIEWLISCRKQAQDVVDKITLRIMKLQEPDKPEKTIGFNGEDKKTS